MIDLYSGFLKKLIYLLIHLQKKNCELKVAFHELFSTCNDRDAVFLQRFYLWFKEMSKFKRHFF